MSTYQTISAATSRSCALSTSSFAEFSVSTQSAPAMFVPAPAMSSTIPSWRDRVATSADRGTGLGLGGTRIADTATHHNSNASVAEAGSNPAKVDATGAAKQAAPPRGVPR